MGSRIVVIGGSGFIGTRLVRRLLDAGHDVRIADIAVSTTFPDLTIRADVRDHNGLHEACKGCDVIYNLAAQHRDDVRPISLYDEVNVGGAKNTCRVANQLGITRMLFVSSVAVYGFSDRELEEGDCTRPFNDYGRTKLEAERVFRAWLEKTNAGSLVIVRPTVIFGEANRGNVYTLLRQIAKGPFVMIGDGKNAKSMAYVENVAAFLEYSLRFGEGFHLHNYADKPDLDMNSLVATIQRALGASSNPRRRIPYRLAYAAGSIFDGLSALTRKPLSISRIRIQKFCSSTRFSAEKALSSGFVPPVDLEQALERTIHHEFGASEMATELRLHANLRCR